MNKVIAWFVHNSVAANLLMMILAVGGMLALPNIYQEEFPNIEVNAVNVRIPYLGAAPAEVESAVCVRVEEAVEGTEGIDKIRSTASEGSCSVVIELVEGVDTGKITNNIKSKVDAIDTFPSETEKPITAEISIIATVLQIAIYGQTDERTLKLIGQQVRDDIAALPGVSQVELLFARSYEISIEVSEQTLRMYGMTLAQIGRSIEKSSLDVPGGSLKTEGGEILLRTKGQAHHGREFEDIIVFTRSDGSTVRLGEIATVIDGFEDSKLRARFDNQPAVTIKVSRVGEEDIMHIAGEVKAYLETVDERFPQGIHFSVWTDESQDLVDRMGALTKNARSGLILVLIILTLFLRFRLALWVAAGLPVAILGTLALFPMAGISISTISVMAFILVLGILVDDAIVVGERVYAHEQQGKNQIQAAIDGTQEVSMPVIFGVFTTMAAFIPIMNIPGSMGGFFGVLGQVVLIALFFSIVESQLILPSHLAHRKPESKQGSNALVNRWLSLQEKISGALEQAANQYYLPAVSRAIQWRYVTLATGIAIVAITSALFVSGRVGVQFLPSVDGTRLYAALTMPEGTPINDTAKASATIERAAAQLQRELDGELEPGQASRIRHIFSSVGAMLPKGSINGGTSMQSNVAEIAIELNLPSDYSGPSTRNFAHRWRELTGDIPDVVELAFTSQSFSAGKAIDIELYGKNFDSLRAAAAELRSALQHFNGVFDITDTFRTGKQEVQLQLLPEARTLGLTMADLGNQVRQAFYGYEAQRIQRGKDDIRVMVRYPADERRSLGDLENMRIRAADGTEVPFASVAQTSLAPGYTTIRRVDGHRVVRVIADVERSITTPEFVLRQLRQKDLQEILQRHPGVNYRLAGEAEERDESMGSLFSNALLALLIIFALLAIPLRSYLQPLIIMSVIPFGAVGAIVGHYILGMDLVFFSLLGIVALSGVVVNSSLVLVDYINNTRKSGQDIESVVSHAGSVRFRPIILTSVTTFVGLTPMMLDGTTSTIMFAPMAVSLAFGVLFGTIITLFLVPSLYMILEDLLTLAGKRNAFEPSTDQHS